MTFTVRPLDSYPQPETRDRRHSPFGASWTQTVDLLDREANMLGAPQVILLIDVTERDCRLDGWIRASARPASPRVVVALDTRDHGPLRYSCDRFHDWRDNVRAVALGLEALRKVERYGIASRGEQYRGWQALPPATAMPATTMTPEIAAGFLIEHGEPPDCAAPARPDELLDLPDGDRADVVAGYYRRAAKRLHPDAGGDPAAFQRLTEAVEALA